MNAKEFNKQKIETLMCDLPLVTIRIPVYNLPLKVFKLLFEQVLNQTYMNLDILVGVPAKENSD